MKELPDFEVVQLKYVYPDDSMHNTIQRLNDEMYLRGWTRCVGAITSMEGETIYLVYEKDVKNDNIRGTAQSAEGGQITDIPAMRQEKVG